MHGDVSLTLVGLAANSENPSFLTLSKDKRLLLSVNELEDGTIEAFTVNNGELSLSKRTSTGGSNPCYVSISNDGRVLVANYSSGSLGLLKVEDPDGLSELLALQEFTGEGTTDRQQSAHAHSAWVAPPGDLVITADLGSNKLWFSTIDQNNPALTFASPDSLSLPPGAGPRHLAFHPDGKWFYVVNELNSTVTLISKNETGIYEAGTSYSTLPEWFSGENTCSDVHLTQDGKYLYVANRGHDSLAVFKCSFMDGSLTLLGHKSSGGAHPRNFALSPDEAFIVIANQLENNLVVLKRDKKSGLLKYKTKLSAHTPTCVVF